MKTVSNEIKSASLKSAFKAGIVRNISEVRENNNEYLFVTLLGNNGKATNVYFGKKSAESVSEGDVLTAEQLKSADIILAMSKDDDDNDVPRLKLSLTGESDYTNLSSIFGDIEDEFEAEVLKALKADMSSKEEDEADAEDDEDDEDEAEQLRALAEAKKLRKAKNDAKALKASKA